MAEQRRLGLSCDSRDLNSIHLAPTRRVGAFFTNEFRQRNKNRLPTASDFQLRHCGLVIDSDRHPFRLRENQRQPVGVESAFAVKRQRGLRRPLELRIAKYMRGDRKVDFVPKPSLVDADVTTSFILAGAQQCAVNVRVRIRRPEKPILIPGIAIVNRQAGSQRRAGLSQ